MTAKAALDGLKAELGGSLPAGVDALDSAAVTRLTEALRRAKKKQQSQVEAALEGALSHVPMLLRGAVRKLFDA